jgi:hypothetical protein
MHVSRGRLDGREGSRTREIDSFVRRHELRQESAKVHFLKRASSERNYLVQTNRQTESPARRNRETEKLALAQILELSITREWMTHTPHSRQAHTGHTCIRNTHTIAGTSACQRNDARALAQVRTCGPSASSVTCARLHRMRSRRKHGPDLMTQMGTTIRRTLAQTSGRNTWTSAS